MKISSNLPSSLTKACQRHADKIEEAYSEGEDGYWIILKDGWWNPDYQAISIHEWTVKACLLALTRIAPDPRPSNER